MTQTQYRQYGLSGAILFVFMLSLVIVGAIYAVLDGPATTLFEPVVESQFDTVREGAGYAYTAWQFFPFFMLILLAAALIQRAIFESRGGV